MIEESFKKSGIAFNNNGSEVDLLIAYNDEEVEEMVSEADQVVAETDNDKKVNIEIVN